MLDHLEVNMEVSSISIETMKSNNCREMSEDARDANGVSATMQEGARFSHKDE